MRAPFSLAFGAFVACVACLACGDTNRPPFHTSLNGGTPLGQLSAADAQQLCFDTWAFFRANDDDVCVASGIRAAVGLEQATPDVGDADLQRACAMARDACQKGLVAQDPLGVRCGSPQASCTGTVEQLGVCLGDAANVIDEVVASIPSCESVTRPGLTAPVVAAVTPALPATCAVVQQGCREYLRVAP